MTRPDDPATLVRRFAWLAAASFLAGFGGDIKITILGGDNAVSEDLALELAEYTNGGIDRVSGATRYETSTKIAEKYFGRVNTVILAYAANFPDALCAGPLGYAL